MNVLKNSILSKLKNDEDNILEMLLQEHKWTYRKNKSIHQLMREGINFTSQQCVSCWVIHVVQQDDHTIKPHYTR